MPDETTPQAVETTSEQPAQQPAGGKPLDFEAWLKEQPEDVRSGYEAHVGGLKSALDKERAAAKKKQDKEAEEERKRQEAALSESEKAAKRIADLEKQNADLTSSWRALQAREALRGAASKAGIAFANGQAEADAIGFALSEVTIGEDGSVEDAEKVLKAVIKDRPYLVKQETGGDGRGTPRPDAKAKTANGKMTDAEKREFAAIYGLDPRYVED